MVESFKQNILSLFKTNATKSQGKPTRVKNVYKGKKIFYMKAWAIK